MITEGIHQTVKTLLARYEELTAKLDAARRNHDQAEIHRLTKLNDHLLVELRELVGGEVKLHNNNVVTLNTDKE